MTQEDGVRFYRQERQDGSRLCQVGGNTPRWKAHLNEPKRTYNDEPTDQNGELSDVGKSFYMQGF